MNTLVTAAATVSGLPLLISLVMGLGQCIIGPALVLRAARWGRWRRFRIYAAGILGLWGICSGMGELAVSGYALAALAVGRFDQHVLDALRSKADLSLLIASAALVVLLCLYPLWLYIAQHRTPAGSPSRSIGED